MKAGMNGKLQEQIIQWGGANAILIKRLASHTSNKMNIASEMELSFTIFDERMPAWPDGYKGEVIYKVYLIPIIESFIVHEVIERPDGKVYFNSNGGKPNVFESAIELLDLIVPQLTDNSKELLLPKSLTIEVPGLITIHLLFRNLDIYKLFNTVEDSPVRTSIRATGIDKLLPNGDNMFQVLNTTGLKSTVAYDAIEAGLHDVNENFQRFRMNVYGQGSVEFYLQEKGLETPIHAAQVSDGTLCYLCLLVALYQLDKGKIIFFDEPERNLHPDMLIELSKQLEKASEKSQIILTTHSPGLLNQFPLRTVRVFEKDENNQTQVRKFTEEQFAGWYDEFVPGQMWSNGDLGGNRY